ncbi:MAG: hypothetical protein ACREX3_23695 [Gammaproteobacteria bacterium]
MAHTTRANIVRWREILEMRGRDELMEELSIEGRESSDTQRS